MIQGPPYVGMGKSNEIASVAVAQFLPKIEFFTVRISIDVALAPRQAAIDPARQE